MEMKLPVGIQSFEKIRSDNFLYVDKTDFIGGKAEDFVPFITAKAVNTRRGGGKPDNTL